VSAQQTWVGASEQHRSCCSVLPHPWSACRRHSATPSDDCVPKMTKQEIQQRLDDLCKRYVETLALISAASPASMNFTATTRAHQLTRALQADFYEAKAAYEGLLEVAPPTPPRTPTPPPVQRRRRRVGRPRTGGRKPRIRRANKDDDDYVP